jgi:hypothetical protein
LIERTIKLEDTLDKFIQTSLANHQNNEAFQKNTEASIRNIETQVGQIYKQLAELTTTPFSANTTTNPKEQCKSIVTRSGKEIGKRIVDHLNEPEDVEGGIEKVAMKEVEKESESERSEEKKNVNIEKEKNKKTKKKGEDNEKMDGVTQVKEVPYYVHPSKKTKEKQYARFLDISNGFK